MLIVTRKQFLDHLAGGSVVLLLGGCGGGGDSAGAPAPAPSPAPAGGCSANILGNHGHVLTIPQADLESTTARTYDILGNADHNHTVTFSATDLANLKAGQTVTVQTSTTLAHSHSISETCA